MDNPRHVSAVLFDGFELLDVAGPLEVFGLAGGLFPVTLVGPAAGPVAGAQGALVADVGWADAAPPDIVLVPGGPGTRPLAGDTAWLDRLAGWARDARLVTSVCTGAALLAAAGLLDGYRATTNRRAFDWVARHGHGVTWERDARWVEDRDRWTSAGVSAGIDLALALVAALGGAGLARDVADRMEYGWAAPGVQRLGPADAGELWTLRRAAFLQPAADHNDLNLPPLVAALADVRAELADDAAIVLGWREAGRLVGAVGLTREGPVVEVHQLVVAPDRQGEGIGTALLRHAEQAFPGTRELRLFTGEHSTGSIRLYEGLGYERTSRESVGTYDLIHFAKRLGA